MNIVIANFFNLISLYYICKELLESRNFKKHLDKFIFLLIFLIISFININGASTQKSLMIFITYIIYILFQFKIHLFNILCAVIPFYAFSLLSELIIGVIINYFFGYSHIIKTYSFIYNIGLITSVLLLLLFSYIYAKFIKYLQLNLLPIYYILIFTFPLATIIFIATLDAYFSFINNTNTMLLLYVSILLSNFSILTIFFLIIRSNKISTDLELSLYRENLIKTKYNLLKNHYDNNFNFLHDLMHKCNRINNYLKDKDMKMLEAELNQLINITFKRFNFIYTNSFALNYVINSKMEELQENKINFISTIKYNDFSFINLEMQVELFSKLLDYSIILSQSIPFDKRNVILKSQKIGQQIIISNLINYNKKELTNIEKNIKSDFQNILQNIPNSNVSVKIKNNDCLSIIVYFLDESSI